MSVTIPERLAVVETKVSTLEELAPKINEVCDYVVAERARRKQRKQFFVAIGGFVGFLGTVWEIFRR